MQLCASTMSRLGLWAHEKSGLKVLYIPVAELETNYYFSAWNLNYTSLHYMAGVKKTMF